MRSVGLFKQLGPCFQVMTFLGPIGVPPGVMVPKLRARPWMVRKTMEQMLKKSGCF